jgi:hypothetical protein
MRCRDSAVAGADCNGLCQGRTRACTAHFECADKRHHRDGWRGLDGAELLHHVKWPSTARGAWLGAAQGGGQGLRLCLAYDPIDRNLHVGGNLRRTKCGDHLQRHGSHRLQGPRAAAALVAYRPADAPGPL